MLAGEQRYSTTLSRYTTTYIHNTDAKHLDRTVSMYVGNLLVLVVWLDRDLSYPILSCPILF